MSERVLITVLLLRLCYIISSDSNIGNSRVTDKRYHIKLSRVHLAGIRNVFLRRIHFLYLLIIIYLCIGECPSNSPFLKKMEPRPIVFKEWRYTRTFSNLKSTHCTLLILLIINLVAKKKFVYYSI
jgi:hypothetical protein